MSRSRGLSRGRLAWRAVALAGALFAFAGLPAQADDKREAEAELKQTEAEIDRLKKMLGNLKQEMSGLESELKESETEIGKLRNETRQIEQQIRDGETRLDDLTEQAERLHAALEAQQSQIARQVRAAYMAGSQDYLKVMLNQDDPARVARMMQYYRYVNAARLEEIEQYQQTIEQIHQASTAIVAEQSLLQHNREQLAERRRSLESERVRRGELLASLDKRSRTEGQRLKQREAERAELSKLIESLDQAVTSIPTPAGNQPFTQAKGKLPLPTQGSIKARFGSQRGDDSRLKWDGLLIAAAEGAPVHAVHGGRVVFAEWLRGAGLLMILDHGNGYLSLYGHNQSLLQEVGTWVKPGETIATVGSSGGLGSPALYFSIRHQGRALDPLAWCMLSG